MKKVFSVFLLVAMLAVSAPVFAANSGVSSDTSDVSQTAQSLPNSGSGLSSDTTDVSQTPSGLPNNGGGLSSDTTDVSGTPNTPTTPTTPAGPLPPGWGGPSFTTGTNTPPASTTPGTVLGADTDLPELPCAPTLTTYMRLGYKNNSAEVKKLQELLNKELNLNLTIDGVFGPSTDKAVKLFQLKYKDEVLRPWQNAGFSIDLQNGTGYVYKTTMRKVNILLCPKVDLPMPVLN